MQIINTKLKIENVIYIRNLSYKYFDFPQNFVIVIYVS